MKPHHTLSGTTGDLSSLVRVVRKWNANYLLFFVLITLTTPLSAQGPPILTDKPIMLGQYKGTARLIYTRQRTSKLTSTNLIPMVDFNVSNSLAVEAGAMFTHLDGSAYKGLKLTDIMGGIKLQYFKFDLKGKTLRLANKINYTKQVSYSHAAIKTTGMLGWGFGGGFLAGFESLKFGTVAEAGVQYLNIPDRLRGTFVDLKLSAGLPLLRQQFPVRQINVYIEQEYLDQIQARSAAWLLSGGLQAIYGVVALEFFYQTCVLSVGNISPYPQRSVGVGVRYIY